MIIQRSFGRHAEHRAGYSAPTMNDLTVKYGFERTTGKAIVVVNAIGFVL
jgi:hypothetical protein